MHKKESNLHIEEKVIELFAYDPSLFDEKENLKITAHLSECEYCHDIYKTYQNIYHHISFSQIKPDENDLLFAERIINNLKPKNNFKQLTQKSTLVKIENGDYKIITRPKLFSLQGFTYIIRNYPFQTAGFISIVALLFILSTFLFMKPNKDLNPVHLRIKNEKLIAYNKSGEILWSKIADFGTDSIEILMAPPHYFMKKAIGIFDIDGDGMNEVLISGNIPNTGYYSFDSLYCINYDGKVRWVAYSESKKFNYAPKWKRTHWKIDHFLTVKKKDKTLLVVTACDRTYGGAIISTLNPFTGEVTSTIYHSGHIASAKSIDINEDGNEELILGGISSYYKPFIMVLEQEKFMGVMPDFYSSGHSVRGNASYYILLPITEISKSSQKSKTSVTVEEIIKSNDTGFIAVINEATSMENESPILIYSFDKDLRLRYISANPTYLTKFERQKKIKITSSEIINNYLSTYKDSLLYWNGDDFVNYPAKNKYWDQKFQLPK
ncbi:hypothetical protein [Rosettibacter firmus]|uniref:hypothetical protein n=1 Tax=Rosettibacter firmus TaxID=3111522 RepID=UPI00336BD4AA